MIIRMRIYMHPYNSVRYNYTPHELAGDFTFTCDSLDEAQQFTFHTMLECDVDCTMYDTYEEVDYALPSHHYSHEYVTQYLHSSEMQYE